MTEDKPQFATGSGEDRYLGEEDEIPYPPDKKGLPQYVFRSGPFRTRVERGVARIESEGAESSFTIYDTGTEIFFTRHGLGDHFSTQGEQVTESRIEDFGTRYETFGEFHFHPDYSNWQPGFSNEDIENYWKDLDRGPKNYFGVFLPLCRIEKGKKKAHQVRLLMVQGPPQDSFFLQEDLSTMTVPEQKECFEASGLKVWVIDLPYKDGKVDLRALKLQ